jgi:hypothetical protein
MMTSLRWITLTEIDGTLVIATFKPYMDIAMVRRPGNKGSISRWVCMT